MKRLIYLAVAIAVLAAACGESDTGPSATTPPTTTIPTTTPPGDPDKQVLIVRREGGLVPPEILFDRLPLYTLYEDGRLVYDAPQAAIFPGPLLPSLIQVDIGANGMAEVMAAIRAAGLPGITELYTTDANNQVADGPNTEVTFFDDNGTHFFSVYSLLIVEHEDPQVVALPELMQLLDRLTATSPEIGPFTIERLQVLASQNANVDDPLAVTVPWPLTITPASMQEHPFGILCSVVDTDDNDGALAAFEQAHQTTFFDSDTVAYRLTVRPLLPGEPGCETFER